MRASLPIEEAIMCCDARSTTCPFVATRRKTLGVADDAACRLGSCAAPCHNRMADRMLSIWFCIALGWCFLGFGDFASAGHSRHPYFDGGQSADGRFVVTAELVTVPGRDSKPVASHWQYMWKDTRTGETHSGKLAGLGFGVSAVFDPLHAHTFIAPNGETFAIWNPNVLAPRPDNAKTPDVIKPDSRDFAGFSHRLTVYRKTGEIVRRLDLPDFLTDDDWNW